MSDMESDDQSLREYYEDRDRTAMAEPLTPGQQIVAWWETSTSASEPADLADKIDAEIERLRAALRWRPIVDAPTSQMILACCLDDKEYELIELIIVESSGKIFNVNSGNYSRSVFSHWMPLPDAPHKEALEEDKEAKGA
mgnify:CR=1 FL=1